MSGVMKRRAWWESLWQGLLRHRVKCALQVVNGGAGMIVLSLSLAGVLPLGSVNFFFFSFLIFLMALYRPVWIFLLLVGMLPYEIVNLAPESLGFFLRPYQWLLMLLFGALAVRWLVGRPVVPRFHWHWTDVLLPLCVGGALLAAIGANPSQPALKLALILASFVGLFFVTRLFVRTTEESLHLVPFLLVSFGVVAGWSVFQNILFALGKTSFEVMAGRPNGTFAEADWLGMYLLLIIALSLAWLYRHVVLRKSWGYSTGPLMVLFFSTLVLLLSMTRSAWLGMAAMGFFFIIVSLVTFIKLGEPRRVALLLARAAGVVGLAVIMIPLLHLSRFSLLDRAVSTGGNQKITIACTEAERAPKFISSIEELAGYGCQHILLEEKEVLRSQGYTIEEIERSDPNVAVRKSIYARVTELIQERPVQGIGWSVVGMRLGSDERGAALNASNMFLEFWLGSGLMGFLAFSLLWFGFGFQSGKLALTGGQREIAFPLFFHLTWIGWMVFNLFNSGILLGFFFFFLGLGGLLFEKRTGA